MSSVYFSDLGDFIQTVFDASDDCIGIGYHELNSGDSVEVGTKSQFSYYASDLCDFSFYAPNAVGIQLDVVRFKVESLLLWLIFKIILQKTFSD